MNRGHATLMGARFLFFVFCFLFPLTSWSFFNLAPKKVEYELVGMKYRQQPPGFNWCWASALQMVQIYKYQKKVSLCSIASEHLNKACCIGVPHSCNQRAFIDEAAENVGESGKHIEASLVETMSYLKKGKAVILSLHRKDGLHYAILQAKYTDNKGYRIFDPANGIRNVTDNQMQTRKLYLDYTWVGAYVIF